jgi:hypothetical protein
MLINGNLGPVITTHGQQQNTVSLVQQTGSNTMQALSNRAVNAEFFDGKGSNFYLNRSNHSGTLASSVIGEPLPIPAIVALNTTYYSGNVYFYGGSNITLSTNGNSISIIGESGGLGAAGLDNISIQGNIQGTPLLISSGTLYLAGGNNITLSQNGNSISIIASSFSQSVQTQGTFNSSQLTNYQQTSLMSNYQTTGNYLTSQSIQTQGTFDSGQLSLYQATSLMSNYQSTGNYLTNQSIQTQNSVQVQNSTGNIQFGNANGISFGGNNGTITASYTVPSIPAQTSVVFSNSNNVSFGLNGSTLTATASFNQSVQTQGTFNTTQLNDYRATSQNSQLLFTSQSSLFALTANDSLSLGTGYTTHTHSQYVNTSQSSLFQTTGNYLTTAMQSGASTQFVQANAIFNGTNISGTIASNALSLSVALGAGGDGLNRIAAGTQTAGTLQTVVFSNSNNVTFGMSNSSVITASVSFNQTVQPVAFSASGSSSNFSTLQFGNTNGISFSISNGSLIGTVRTDYQSSNANYLTSQLNQAFSASGGSSSFQTLSFANSNGLTFSNSNGSIIASYTVPSQTVQPGIQSIQVSNTTYTTGNVIFSNANGLSFGSSAGGAITASYTVPNATVFSNSNNVSFGLNGSTITATATFNQTVQTQNLVSVQGSTGNISFSNANGITFGFNASTITASHNGLTSQLNQAFSASGGSSSFQTLNFANSNGFTFSNSNGSVIGSYTVPSQTIQSYNVLAAGTQTAQTSGTVAFNNSNGITFGMSNNSIITASHNGITSQTVQTQNMISVQGSTGNIVFSNANNVSFGFNASTITGSASFNQSYQPLAVSGSNGSFTASTLSFGNLNGLSFYSSNGSIVASYTDAGAGGGISAINLSAGSTSNNLTNFVFADSNNISFGLNGSTVTASFNPINVGISTNGNTAGTTGTIDGGNAQYLFHGGNGITLSQSINGSSATLSFVGQTDVTLSRMYMWPYGQISSSGMTNSQMSLRYFSLDDHISFSKIEIPINVSLTSSATAATGNIVFSSGAVIYSANGSTLNPIVGQLASTTHTWASNNTNYSNVIGGRYASFGLATALTPGEYWLGVYLSTTNNSSIGTATTAQNFVDFGQSTGVSSIGPVFMQGLISQVITNTTQTFQASQITMSGAQGLRGNILFNLRNI